MSVIENLKFSWSEDQPLINIGKWELADSGISTLMGPSGSGKSTLLRCLLGLEKCTGSWNFKGENIFSLPVEKRGLAVVFQDLALYPHMTAEQNILFSAKARGLDKSSIIDSLTSLSDKLDMSGFLRRQATQLPAGQAHRVALARALIVKPKFLFLDEPFSSLDADLRQESRQLVKQIIQESNIPCLLISHDMADIEALSEHRFVLNADGSVT